MDSGEKLIWLMYPLLTNYDKNSIANIYIGIARDQLLSIKQLIA